MRIDSYDLHFDVDFGRSVLKGKNKISLHGAEDPLVLDSSGIEILSVKTGGRAAKFEVDERDKKLLIRGVGGGRAEVEVNFVKQVEDDMIFGLYKSRYGKDHLLVTDLEPIGARTVFPCKDEPSYKAVFRVSVTADDSLSVIANAALSSKSKAGRGRSKFIFEPTPRMSTYLFFLGVGKFDQRALKSDGVTIVAASRPGTSKGSEYVLEYSAKIVKRLGEYYGIPYPLSKLHLIGLPEYHTGAMENWGAITYREPYVVLPERASVSARRNAVHIGAHEIAHQWFGDLVTMKWWDDVWLNESFATFMDNKVMDMLEPSWDSWGLFISGRMLDALFADGLSGTHPIQVKVESDADLHSIFDAISYSKGASVLRMIEGFIGDAAFRKGVSAYLKKFRELNAKGEDLWNSLETASSLPVSRVTKEWIRRPGFPYVKASSTSKGIALTQQRFLLSGKSGSGVWPIPLEVKVGGRSTKMLMEKKTVTVPARYSDLVVVNPRRKGFYSVLYDEDLYGRLEKGFQGLHPYDASGVVSDLFLFMHAGMADPEQYFRFISLARDTDSSLLARVLIAQLTTLWVIASESKAVRDGCVKFAAAQLRRVGVEGGKGDDPEDSLLRERAALFLARADPGFAKKLAKRFGKYAEVEPELRGAVAVSYAVSGGRAEYDAISRMIPKMESEVDRGYLYSGLTAFEDPKLVERALEFGIGGGVARSDTAYTLRGSAANPKAKGTLWKWLTKRYGKLYDMYGGTQQFYLYMDDIIPICGVGIDAQVKKFISGKRYEEGRMTYRRTFEVLAIHTALRKRLMKMRA